MKRTEWGKSIDCFGLSIEADPSRVGKKNVKRFSYLDVTVVFLVYMEKLAVEIVIEIREVLGRSSDWGVMGEILWRALSDW